MRTRLRYAGALILMLLVITGCSGRATLSQAARSGDSVLVAVESSEPSGLFGYEGRLTSPMLREADVTATINDSNLVAHIATIRRLFRVYADPTAVNQSAAGAGEWMALVDLVDSQGTPLALATGTASLVLSSPHLSSDIEMEIEILPGTGSPHTGNIRDGYAFINPLLDYSASLVPGPQASVGIAGALLPGKLLIAAEFVFEFPDVTVIEGGVFGPVEKRAGTPIKLPFNNEGIYFDYKEELLSGQTGTRITVMLSAPRGLTQGNQFRPFHFVMTSDQAAINAQPGYWQTSLVSSVFYDQLGNELGSLAANVGNIQ